MPIRSRRAPLLSLSLLVSLCVAARPATGQQEDPAAVVRAARSAVEGDSARPLAERWRARLRRDSSDRAAMLGLATIAGATYDGATADSLFPRLYADSAAPDRFSVYALLEHANAWEGPGGVTRRQRLFEQALATARRIGERHGEAEALVALSFVRGNLTGMEAALATLDSAAPLVPRDDRALRADLLWRRSLVLDELGRPEAEQGVRAAVAAAREVGTPRAEAFALRAVGQHHYIGGRSDSAAAYYRRAEALFRRAHDHVALAKTLTMRGNAHWDRGELRQLRDASNALVEESRRVGWMSGQGVGLSGLAIVYRMLGDLEPAISYLERAADISRQRGDSMVLLATRALLGETYLAAGDLASAKRLMAGVQDDYRRRAEHDTYFQTQRTLISIAIRERDWAGARRLIDELHALRRKYPIAPRDLAYQEGRVAVGMGDLAGAERAFARYYRSLDTTQHVLRWNTQLRLAQVSAARGALDRAERELVAASRTLDAWRATLSDADMRRSVFQVSVFDRDEERDVFARVIATLATGGHAAAAFDLAERRRARELADRMTRAVAMRGDGAAGAATTVAASPLTSAEIAAALPDDSLALLEYVVGSGAPTTLFVAARGGLRAFALSPADSLVRPVEQLLSLLESGADGRRLARALGSTLLDSALAGLDPRVTRLVVVPDGALHRVPFDALLGGDGRYVVERYAVGTAPSASVVSALWRRGAAGASRVSRLLAFGDPAFAGETPADEGARVSRAAFAATGGLPRLAESGREARAVARYAERAEVRLRERASAAFLKRAPLDSFAVIHFATHAIVDDRSVARTALALAPGDGESGFVGPGDLATLRLDAGLVVLSACRSAAGVVLGGEGVQGLTSPLLEAGARSVVATGWRIDDRGTVALVEDFYDALGRGLPVAAALRAAKLEAIRRGAPPAEWAAFQVVGDPLVRVPLRTPPGPGWPTVAAVGLLALALAGVAVYGARSVRARASERTIEPSAA